MKFWVHLKKIFKICLKKIVSLEQQVRQKSDISERRSKDAPFNPY